MSKKHIATYPIYGCNPITLRVNTRNRVGTGYVYSVADIAKVRERLEPRGHPVRLRWRNDECRAAAMASLKAV